MHKGKVVLRIAMRNIKKWYGNARIISLAILMTLFIFSYLRPIQSFASISGIQVSPWAFPFLASDFYTQIVLLLGAVMLFCDAPFMDDSQIYVIQRSGKRLWGYGQIVYIFLASLIYIAFVFIISIVALLPNVAIQDGWGKIIGTLASTNAGVIYNVPITFSLRIIYLYTPLEALGYSLLLLWLLVLIIGLITFVFNTIVHKSAGIIINCAMIMFNYFINNMLPSSWYAFSPVAMGNLSILQGALANSTMTVPYGFTVLTGVLFLVTMLSVLLCQPAYFRMER